MNTNATSHGNRTRSVERLRNPDLPETLTVYGENLEYEYQIPLRDLLNEAADRMEELEKCILMARDAFFADNSDGKAAAEMLRILNDKSEAQLPWKQNERIER